MENAQNMRLIRANNDSYESVRLSFMTKGLILGGASALILWIYHPAGLGWIKFREIVQKAKEFQEA